MPFGLKLCTTDENRVLTGANPIRHYTPEKRLLDEEEAFTLLRSSTLLERRGLQHPRREAAT